MATKGNNDGGGRRGQQQRRLRLRCNFVAASGVGCNKGVAAIGGRQDSDVHDCCGGGQQRYGARDGCCCVQFVAGHDQDSWQRMIVAGCDVNKLQRKIAAGSFLLQRSLLAAIEDDSKRSLLAALGSERCVLRLKGRLKGWWTEGFDFLVRIVAILGAIWGCGFVEFRLRIGVVLGL
ncbi:hypothetical protein BHM03_00059015 [Ensete ventricosum]|nr:hypothetical protein BHM03_00059015 [Ensete ventricosum]